MTEHRVSAADGVRAAAATPGLWRLHLFVASDTPSARTAITNLTLFCECRLAGRYKLAVTDVVEEPDVARGDEICAVPSLLRRYPPPIRMIIGDFADFDALARSLGIAPDSAAAQVSDGQTDLQGGVHLNMGTLVAPALSTPATVLIADDQDCVRGLAADLLGLYGYNVLTAGNGEEALSTLQQHGGKVDLVVTDVMMPVMNGPEFVARLRPLYPNIKVLFMSGYSDCDITDQIAQFPGAQLVAKPFALDTLVQKVREVLGVAQA
jgi:CheY-like chemotaxis protein